MVALVCYKQVLDGFCGQYVVCLVGFCLVW